MADTLTRIEQLSTEAQLVLAALWNDSAGNGHDFGYTDGLKAPGIARKQMSGYISAISQAGLIYIVEDDEDGFAGMFEFDRDGSGRNDDRWEFAQEVHDALLVLGVL